MFPREEESDVPNRARRHLFGLAAAAGARLALVSTVAWATMQSSATSQIWGGRGGSGAFGGNGANGSNGTNGRGGTGAPGANGGNGGSAIAGGPQCFLRGTSIRTDHGEVRIEDLRAGELVETLDGRLLQVKWIGRQNFGEPDPSCAADLMPIRIARHAIDDRTPHKDLYVSPWHALYINGALIRAKDLVNGASIMPALPPDQGMIEYFHIILDSHEVVFAQGMPAETLLIKNGSHLAFENFREYEALEAGNASASTPFAPTVGSGGREHLKSLLFLGFSRFIDLDDPLHPVRRAHEKLAARAEQGIE